MNSNKTDPHHPGGTDPSVQDHQLVSLKRLSTLLDADRSTIRRWLRDAGINPVAVGRGARGGVRYRWTEVEKWIQSLDVVD